MLRKVSRFIHRIENIFEENEIKNFFPVRLEGTTIKWTMFSERLWGYRAWTDAPEPESSSPNHPDTKANARFFNMAFLDQPAPGSKSFALESQIHNLIRRK